ncbi:N-acetyltransferase [Nocardioides guangzhouensis]|uniref:N-acetyltransferase n=1 Tax=Nocardioides guangzhouensis TaxID=2497878 RepID=A0A4Q4Z6B8_9ACTN|nr:N-acetyltransferase [Nocardioides guangzhouensis]RYP82631.1 N-acetyltransferase [Nocardioides guangzhouensis]
MSESVVPAEGEHLTNGWEPDAPEDDSLVRRAVLVHASWPVAVARALGAPHRRTDGWAGALIGSTGELSNPVVLTRPVAAADAADLVAEVGALVPPESAYFLLSPWLEPDYAAHGLVLIGHPPLMARFPRPDEQGSPVAAPDGVEVVEVADAERLAVAERVLVEGYPMPGTAPGSILRPGLLDGATRVWLGYVDGEPASVACAHTAHGATLVEYVAALPSARGRGAGAAVTRAATLADPALPAVLVASDDGRPTYERLGYVAIERWTAWLRPAG